MLTVQSRENWNLKEILQIKFLVYSVPIPDLMLMNKDCQEERVVFVILSARDLTIVSLGQLPSFQM